MNKSLSKQLEDLLESVGSFTPEQRAAINLVLAEVDRLEHNHNAMYETLLSYPASISDLCPDYDDGIIYCDDCGEDEEYCCCNVEPCDVCGLAECECIEIDDDDDYDHESEWEDEEDE